MEVRINSSLVTLLFAAILCVVIFINIALIVGFIGLIGAIAVMIYGNKKWFKLEKADAVQSVKHDYLNEKSTP